MGRGARELIGANCPSPVKTDCIDENPRDPFRFAIRIGVGIEGMEVPAVELQRFVLTREVAARPQIIAEGQVPFDFDVPLLETMQMDFATAGGRVVERAIAPTVYSQLSKPPIANFLECVTRPVERNQIMHHGQ